MNLIQTKAFCASSSNLADMLPMVNHIDFGGHISKVRVTSTMGIIDICGVRGDATLCVVIFNLNSMPRYFCIKIILLSSTKTDVINASIIGIPIAINIDI